MLNKWVLSLDLNCTSKSLLRRSEGSEFQSWGAARLKALLPIVTRRTLVPQQSHRLIASMPHLTDADIFVLKEPRPSIECIN